MRRILRALAASGVFVAAYILVVGVVTWFNVIMLGHGEAPWLDFYWPLWSIFFTPAAVTALLAAWYSGLTLRRAVPLLGTFLVLILIVVEAAWLTFAAWPRAEHFGQQMLVGELAFLAGVFFVAASICRRRLVRHQTSTP